MTREKALDIVTQIKEAEKKLSENLAQASKDQDKKIRDTKKEVQDSYSAAKKAHINEISQAIEAEQKKLDKEIAEMAEEGKRTNEELIKGAQKKLDKAVEKVVQRILG